MKYWSWLLLAFAVALTGSAQTLPVSSLAQPAGLQVLGFSFSDKTSSRLELQSLTTGQNGYLQAGNLPVQAEFGVEPRRGREIYGYRRQTIHTEYANLIVKNSSGKTIKAVTWEYVLPRFVKGKEVAYWSVRSKVRLEPNQVQRLSQPLPYSTCRRQTLSQNGTEYTSQVCGRQHVLTTAWHPVSARIRRVEYTDGSSWQAP